MNNTLTNGLSLLLTLANSGQAHGVTELSKLTGFPKSHVHRLLTSLVAAQCIEKTEQSRYRIGVGALRLGRELLRNIPIRILALPEMMEVVRKHRINLTLAMPFGLEAIVVAFVSHDGRSRSPMESLGGQLSPNTSASGKLFLALKHWDELPRILPSLDYTQTGPNTHLDANSLLEDLETIKLRGYSTNNHETSSKGFSIACPIFDQNKQVYAALGISATTEKISRKGIVSKLEILKKSTQRIHNQIQKNSTNDIANDTSRSQ